MYNVSISVMWMRIWTDFEVLSEVLSDEEQNKIVAMTDAMHSFDEDPLTSEQKQDLYEIYDKYFDIDGSLKSQRSSGIK